MKKTSTTLFLLMLVFLFANIKPPEEKGVHFEKTGFQNILSKEQQINKLVPVDFYLVGTKRR